jgi:hypothetical protein
VRPLPAAWDDVSAARRGTGREPLTDADQAALGDDAGAFPPVRLSGCAARAVGQGHWTPCPSMPSL